MSVHIDTVHIFKSGSIWQEKSKYWTSQGLSQGLSSPVIVVRNARAAKIDSCLNLCEICFCHCLQVICKVIEVDSTQRETLLKHRSFGTGRMLCDTGDLHGMDWLVDWRNASDNKWNASSDNQQWDGVARFPQSLISVCATSSSYYPAQAHALCAITHRILVSTTSAVYQCHLPLLSTQLLTRGPCHAHCTPLHVHVCCHLLC